MPFEQSPDGLGKIYIPEQSGKEKKQRCPDCFACQWCSDERCKICRPRKACPCDKSGNSEYDRSDL
ncbi:MAG: hypothetical protein ACLFV2_00265 [Desulfurivibrionaceae bacterium]